MVCNCEDCGPNGNGYNSSGPVWDRLARQNAERHFVPSIAGNKFIYVGEHDETPERAAMLSGAKKLEFLTEDGGKRYNFAKGLWCDDDNTKCEDFNFTLGDNSENWTRLGIE